MKTVKQYDFADIFNWVTDNYGIHWNPCNDIFFHNSLDYGSVTDWYPGEWNAYVGFENPKAKAGDYTREELDAMSNQDKSYILLDAYFESLGVTGEVQIDSR